MKVWLAIAFLVISAAFANGQDEALLGGYLLSANASDRAFARSQITSLVEKLDSKQKKSERQFLKSVFNIAHRQLLIEYDQYSGFDEIFKSGKYDCLTATALYSLLLNQLGFSHKVIETNYHIFLLVDTQEGLVLLESTDPINGFEVDQERIDSRIKFYKNQNNSSGQDGIVNSTYRLYSQVSNQELTGLLYYNQSVKAFNEQRWNDAIQMLQAAKQYYTSPRITEMEILLMQLIASIELEKIDSTSPESGLSTVIAAQPY